MLAKTRAAKLKFKFVFMLFSLMINSIDSSSSSLMQRAKSMTVLPCKFSSNGISNGSFASYAPQSNSRPSWAALNRSATTLLYRSIWLTESDELFSKLLYLLVASVCRIPIPLGNTLKHSCNRCILSSSFIFELGLSRICFKLSQSITVKLIWVAK